MRTSVNIETFSFMYTIIINDHSSISNIGISNNLFYRPLKFQDFVASIW